MTEDHNLPDEPRPWWYRTAERLLTVALIFAIGLPVVVVTREPLYAGLAGAGGALLINVIWWRVVKGEALTDVYDALSPWV